MQFIKTLVRLPLFLSPFTRRQLLQWSLLLLTFFPNLLIAQTTYLHQGDKQTMLLERLEIKAGRDSILNFSKVKPFSRKMLVNGIRSYMAPAPSLSKVDDYNIKSVFLNNLEWVSAEEREQYKSKKSILKNFYRTPANLYEVHVTDFDLFVNPVVQYVISKENDNDQNLFLNTRGLTIRGRIANKIGFSAYLTDNQERDPAYVQEWIQDRLAVPGAGFYKDFKDPGGYDYFDARGHFTFNVTKYIDVAFGYDKNFIGNGYRSLFLSDFSSSGLFLRLNTRIWRINYQNLFMELQNADNRIGDKPVAGLTVLISAILILSFFIVRLSNRMEAMIILWRDLTSRLM
jgi:hypothetical protein